MQPRTPQDLESINPKMTFPMKENTCFQNA